MHLSQNTCLRGLHWSFSPVVVVAAAAAPVVVVVVVYSVLVMAMTMDTLQLPLQLPSKFNGHSSSFTSPFCVTHTKYTWTYSLIDLSTG